MSDKGKRKVAVIIAAFMLLLLVLSPVVAVFTKAGALSELDKLKNKQKQLAGEKKTIAAEIKQIEKDKVNAAKKKSALDKQIDLTEQEIENTEKIIEELTLNIETKTHELAAAIDLEDEEYALYLTRVRAMEEHGDATYLGILLSADSFFDLLNRFDVINEIIQYDQGVIIRLAETREKIKLTKLDLEMSRLEQDEVHETLDTRKKELNEQSLEADALINNLEKEETEHRRAYNEAEAAEKKLNESIDNLLKELAKKNSVYVGGTYTWPLPGHYNITSEFGSRFHPVLKVNSTHTGMDIGAPKGTKIIAANAGTVVEAGYNTGYGNYVLIDHGGGKATMYAHMSKIRCSVDKKVSKGQHIGDVGSTGYSTGPHLHFEIIENGVRKNPRNYFTKVQ